MCPDREMLVRRYHADFRLYAEAERSLERAIGSNFFDAWQRANRARLVFERAREQLNTHICWHHCWAGIESFEAAPLQGA
jgi:hypothetical protein